MKLTDLDASFVGKQEPGGYSLLDSVDGAQGVLFQCPLCAASRQPGEKDGRRFYCGAHYVLCWFVNPRNAPPVGAEVIPKPGRWTFSGDTLDTLTLSPSVHLTGNGCGWHGWVQNGEAN